jgi:hypothetical protein
MGERLTADDFNDLFRYFRDEAFRLEVQPVYDVDAERRSVQEFLRGEPRPATEYPFYATWLDRIRAATARGGRVVRVRVLEEPPTEYQQWEVWMGRYNVEAGETIRYLPRSKAIDVGVPTMDDWWLFDSQSVALMRFSPTGVPLGGEIITAAPVVVRHCAWRDLAILHSATTAACGPA